MSAPLLADRPTIKILIYTDNPLMADTEDSRQFLGLGSMHARLMAHAPAFADLKIKFVCRNSDPALPADNKLNVVLRRETFDEIWLFGLNQANTKDLPGAMLSGGSENELDQDEVNALRDWMKINETDGSGGGGVLITGDHSEEPADGLAPGPTPPCPDKAATAPFLGLGRAIGRCVPRAGLMRAWENEPTNRPIDRATTIARSGFQLDRIPQQLNLVNVNASGDPDRNGQPHPLFFYAPGRFIEVFPDHAHEGAITLPTQFDEETWPRGATGQPQPRAVAKGTNQRNSELIDVVAVYNGDLAGVGRIVADSTWHHYVNLNLKGFDHPAPRGSASDQIGQFYGNLAVWLAPRAKRVQMARAMSWQLAQYTLLLEPRGDVLDLSKAAYDVVSQVASPCEIHELIQTLVPQQVGPLGFSAEASYLPSPELVLGYVLDSYHQQMRRVEVSDSDPQAETVSAPLAIEHVVNSGFSNAVKEHADELQRKLDALKAITLK